MIIDAHVHLPVGLPTRAQQKAKLLDEMRRNGVDKGVVIADSYTQSDIGSMSECAELFLDTDNVCVVGGISPLADYEEQLRRAERYLDLRMIAGLKLYPGHEDFYLDDVRLAPVYELARKFDVPVLFHSGWDNAHCSAPEIIRHTAEKYNGVKLVCCHCCYPDIVRCFDTLRRYDNVYFDISSIADNVSLADGFAKTLHNAIADMPQRFVFGSDYGSCSQSAHVRFAQNLDITDEQREKLMSGIAQLLYRM